MNVLILTSGMGLGHYVPALLLRDELRRRKQQVELRVIESLLNRDAHIQIARTMAAYQSDFRKALVGQRLHGMLSATPQMSGPDGLDIADRIVVFAGGWCPHLLAIAAAKVDLVHVDLALSPSWLAAVEAVCSLKDHGARELWLSRKEAKGRRLVVADCSAPPIAWVERQRRVLVHGGGWAIGDLKSAILDLDRRLSVDVLLGSRPALDDLPGEVRQFGSPANWQPWSAPPDRPFPPLFKRTAKENEPVGSGTHHKTLELLGCCLAVISKPGGMTLAESLMTATPVIFLPPFGAHERINADTWIDEGFGIWFDDWKERGFADEALEALHLNLLAARNEISQYDCE